MAKDSMTDDAKSIAVVVLGFAVLIFALMWKKMHIITTQTSVTLDGGTTTFPEHTSQLP